MKVHIHIAQVGIDQVVQARDAGELLALTKAEAARRAPFLLRGVVRGMGDLQFAAEAVKRVNAQSGQNDPPPRSAQEFLDWAQNRGYITILEE